MKQSAKVCQHTRAIFEFRGGVFRKGYYQDAIGTEDFGYSDTVIRATCGRCNAKLPLGPAYEPEAVRVEMRAAEIAACDGERMSDIESRGYGVHPFAEDHPGFASRDVNSTVWLSGWLASEIDTHDDCEQRDADAWPWDPTRPVAGQYAEFCECVGAAAMRRAIIAQNPPGEPFDTSPKRRRVISDCIAHAQKIGIVSQDGRPLCTRRRA